MNEWGKGEMKSGKGISGRIHSAHLSVDASVSEQSVSIAQVHGEFFFRAIASGLAEIHSSSRGTQIDAKVCVCAKFHF